MKKKRNPKGSGTIYYSTRNNLWTGQMTLLNGKRISKYSEDKEYIEEWLKNEQTKANLEKKLTLYEDLKKLLDKYTQ